jgi:hypothetical protein
MKKAEPTERQKNRIRQKLADGTLPRVLPGVTIDPAPGHVPLMTASPREEHCDACDEPGTVRPIGGLRWQDTCFTFWVAVTDGS